MPTDHLVSRIRLASRDMVRELGFMRPTLAESGLSASAVHALIEIGSGRATTQTDLARALILEKSTVSRLIQGLEAKRLVRRAKAPEDGRRRRLALGTRGEEALSGIDAVARARVAAALGRVGRERAGRVADGLELYAGALRDARLGTGAGTAQTPDAAPAVTIERGYAPGLIGRLVELQISTYAPLFGFGATFETKVAAGLADFVERLGAPENETWRAERAGALVGGISIDAQDLGRTAGGAPIGHLRWFVVDPALRGLGVGARLMETAMAFCDDAGFAEVRLTTVKGLDAARVLYERHGFQVTDEAPGTTWGRAMTEQTYTRFLA